MDFTISKYKELLSSLISNKYNFQTFSEFLKNPKDRVVILRHDVDLLPNNSLIFAKIQKKYGIKGTYYFRSLPCSFHHNIMIEIESMNHEIGYHYENMDLCRGDVNLAFDDFKKELSRFRKICNIETICMHGSPMSKYDNKDLWKFYNYKELHIIGEPYFELNFDSIYYLTDTGRGWNKTRYSRRDKVNITNHRFRNINVKNTDDIIDLINTNNFPNQIMITFHPQRWTDNYFLWAKELIIQNIKNFIKYIIIKLNY